MHEQIPTSVRPDPLLPRIVLLDPGPQVPAYDRALAGALAAEGLAVSLAMAPLLHYDPGPPAPGVAVDLAFGRMLGAAAGLVGHEGASTLSRRPLARRALRLAGYPAELAHFTRRLASERPAALHVQWPLVPPLEALAWRRLRAAGVPVVLTAHNVLPHEPRPWQPATWRRLYRAVDRLIVHSQATASRLAALLGDPSPPIHVVPMAADLPASQPDRPAARARLGLATEVPLALFFGHVRPYKGLEVLLAAWPAVQVVLPAARLWVAGPVAGGAAAADRLRERLARAGLGGTVALRPGFVASAEVDDLFAAADLVALPYLATDDSAVLQAARGRGRAVVASAVGGLPELIDAGGGILVPPGRPAPLATALIHVLGEPALREALEAEARAVARSRTWADVAQETRSVYRAAGAAV